MSQNGCSIFTLSLYYKQNNFNININFTSSFFSCVTIRNNIMFKCYWDETDLKIHLSLNEILTIPVE